MHEVKTKNIGMKNLLITTIQSPLYWENKAANLEMFERKILGSQEKMEVVVLPEMFNTGFSMQPARFAEKMDGPTVKWMKNIAAAKKIILTGSLIIEEDNRYFNRLLWVLPNGEIGYYDKRHLFGYAEEDQYYTAGAKRLTASVKGWKINLQICYDLRFPVWARQSLPMVGEERASPEYDLLIYVANWPETRSLAWKTLLRARAIENQSFVVGVNRIGNDGKNIYHSGDSMIIDPIGNIIYDAGQKEELVTTELSGSQLTATREKFPFLKDADPFMIGN